MTANAPSAASRWALLREIVGKPLSKSLVGVLAFLGTAATIREVALPESVQAQLNFYRLWTLSWPWWLWEIVVLGAGVVVLFEGAVAAVRARQSRLQELESELLPRPWLTVEYSSNATEEEPEVADTLIFENIGNETAFAVSISTEPSSFKNATPRLGLPLNTLLPHTKAEVVVFGLDGILHRLRRAIVEKRGKSPDLRIPLRIHYADRHGRSWSNEYAAVNYYSTVIIQDITGQTPNWTDLTDLIPESITAPRPVEVAQTA